MNKKVIFVMAIIFSLVTGWILGYFRLPQAHPDTYLILGFLSAFALIAFVIVIKSVFQFIDNPNIAFAKITLVKVIPGLFVLVYLGAFITNHLLVNKSIQHERTLQKNEETIDSLSHQLTALRMDDNRGVLSQLIQDIHSESRQNEKRILSQGLIDRIVAVNSSLKPYKILTDHGLSENILSPERGMLLLNLIAAKLDSANFSIIKSKTSFSYADLSGTVLNRADLSNIDLSFAMLKDAQLKRVNLNNAKLEHTNFWGANLQYASMDGANLKRATLEKANLLGAVLRRAILDGANAKSVRLKNADLSQASIQWADFRNAILKDADLEGSFCNGTDFRQANLSNVIFNHARLKRNIFDRANLIGVSLKDVLVREEKWMDRLTKEKVKGVDDIKNSYRMEDSITVMTRHILKEIEN